jgi:hypothetical protein
MRLRHDFKMMYTMVWAALDLLDRAKKSIKNMYSDVEVKEAEIQKEKHRLEINEAMWELLDDDFIRNKLEKGGINE